MITIRSATEGDVPVIRDIIHRSVLASYARFLPEAFTEWFVAIDRAGEIAAQFGDRFFIAERDSVPAGVMLVKGDYIDHLWTDPDHMGRGVGTALLGRAETVAAEAGFSRLTLDCLKKNTEGLAFYRRKGFAVERTYRATDIVPGENVCLMTRAIPACATEG